LEDALQRIMPVHEERYVAHAQVLLEPLLELVMERTVIREHVAFPYGTDFFAILLERWHRRSRNVNMLLFHSLASQKLQLQLLDVSDFGYPSVARHH
jgi:hypothetical protein